METSRNHHPKHVRAMIAADFDTDLLSDFNDAWRNLPTGLFRSFPGR